jgi:hypothetical protein
MPLATGDLAVTVDVLVRAVEVDVREVSDGSRGACGIRIPFHREPVLS